MERPFSLVEQEQVPRVEVPTDGVRADKDKQVLYSELLLEAYKSGQQQWREKAQQDDEFRSGNQIPKEIAAELKARRQQPVIINVIHPAVEQAKAMLTTNHPQFSATGREDSDTKTAKMFADLLSYIWQISSGNAQAKTAIDDYYVRGMGALCAYFDPNADFGKGEIFIKSVDTFDVYIDPNAKSRLIEDAAHVIISTIETAEQLQQNYPDILPLLDLAEPESDENWGIGVHSDSYGEDALSRSQDQFHNKYRIIDRYSRVKVQHHHILQPEQVYERVLTEEQFSEFLEERAFIIAEASGKEHYVVHRDDVENTAELYEKTGGLYHYAPDPETGEPVVTPGHEDENPYAIPGTTTAIHPVTMGELLEIEYFTHGQVLVDRIKRVLSVGGLLLYSDVLPISTYPIVPIMNHHRRNPYPQSDVRFVRPLQEQINKLESLIVAHAASSTNVKVWYPEGSVNEKTINEKMAMAGTVAIPYNPDVGGHPVIAAPVPLPGELYRNKDEKKREIEHILGIYAMQQGDVSQSPDTYKGTLAMDEFGQRRIRSKKDDIEDALNVLCRVVIELIQAYYTEHKVIRIARPNNKPVEFEVNRPVFDDIGNVTGKINDVTVGQYDVVVVSGSMLPANRWAQFEYYMELYDRQIIDHIEVLKKTEVVDYEGVLERMDQMRQMMQQIEEMQNYIKDLEGQLQTTTRESIHDKKRVEVEKFKTKLHQLGTRAEGATRLFDARLNDELKKEKESQREKKRKESGGRRTYQRV
jgi:hypothetical protein